MSVIDYVFGVTRIRFSLPGYAAGRYFLVLLLMAAIGLSPLLAQANDTIYTDDTGPDVPLYKTANEDFTRNIPLRTDPAEVEKSWEQKDFYVIETDLSPARLIHNQTNEIPFPLGTRRPVAFRLCLPERNKDSKRAQNRLTARYERSLGTRLVLWCRWLDQLGCPLAHYAAEQTRIDYQRRRGTHL